MHPLARILAVAYLALAVVGGFVLVQTSLNYVNVTDINVNIEGKVAVTGVEILWNRSSGVAPIVKVSVTATNPGRIPIEATSVDFHLHMDDPNDVYLWFDNTGLELTRIAPGGITKRVGQGFVIPPGTSRIIEILVPILSQEQMARFDLPDADGRYHPVVWEPRFIYFFVGFDLFNSVFPPPYYEGLGVVPIG